MWWSRVSYWNSDRVILAAATQAAPPTLEAHELEALTYFLSLNFAFDCCCLDIILEGDNVTMTEALTKHKHQENYFGLISNCIALPNKFRSFTVSHMKRDANKVAYELAKIALTKPNSVWLEGALNNILSLAILDSSVLIKFSSLSPIKKKKKPKWSMINYLI